MWSDPLAALNETRSLDDFERPRLSDEHSNVYLIESLELHAMAKDLFTQESG